MESVKFSYTITSDILNKGIELSGLFNPSRSRQIVLSLLMALVFANAVYGTISLKEFTARNVFYLIASVVIVLVLWLEPTLRIKNHKKNLLGKTADIEVKKGEITAVIGEEKLNIIGEGLKGFRDEGEYIIIYFAGEYALLPKAQKTQEEINMVIDYLTNFLAVKEEQ